MQLPGVFAPQCAQRQCRALSPAELQLRWLFSLSMQCLIEYVFGAWTVLQEGMRVVRCHDSSINSTLAAGAASYILVSFQSEPFPPSIFFRPASDTTLVVLLLHCFSPPVTPP